MRRTVVAVPRRLIYSRKKLSGFLAGRPECLMESDGSLRHGPVEGLTEERGPAGTKVRLETTREVDRDLPVVARLVGFRDGGADARGLLDRAGHRHPGRRDLVRGWGLVTTEEGSR